MGSVYLWGSLGSFHCFWVVCQRCHVTWFCHVALWLVVDYSDQWGGGGGGEERSGGAFGDVSVSVGMSSVVLGPSRLEGGCYGAPFSPL